MQKLTYGEIVDETCSLCGAPSNLWWLGNHMIGIDGSFYCSSHCYLNYFNNEQLRNMEKQNYLEKKIYEVEAQLNLSLSQLQTDLNLLKETIIKSEVKTYEC